MRNYFSINLRVIFLLCLLLANHSFSADPRIICVLPFDNSTGKEEFDPLKTLISDIFVDKLTGYKGVTVVERQKLDEVVKEQRFQLSGVTKEETKIKLGRLLGANLIVTGGFTYLDGNIKINAHLFEVETTKLLGSEENIGKPADIIRLINGMFKKLITDLKIERTNPNARVDEDPETNLQLIKGLGLHYGGMYDRAIVEYMEVLMREPANVDAYFFRAESYYAGKEFRHARLDYEKILKDFPDYKNNKKVKERLNLLKNGGK